MIKKPFLNRKLYFQHKAMETDATCDSLHLHLESSSDTGDSEETTVPKAPPKPAPAPMMMKVKSADGKPRNIQITTLSTNTSTKSAPIVPQIKVRSADGKPKNIQFETLATFTSPSAKKKEPTSPSVVKDKAGSDCILIDDSPQKGKEGLENTPKSASSRVKTGDTPKSSGPGKGTPKRVQLTTIQLFDNAQSPSQSKS